MYMFGEYMKTEQQQRIEFETLIKYFNYFTLISILAELYK